MQNRQNLTDEQRKNTRPDIDRKDVVFADDSGVKYLRDDLIIYPNISENTREKILKSSRLRCVKCDVDDASIDSITVESLIDLNHSKAQRILKVLYEKFGLNNVVFSNSVIDFDFRYSKGSMDKSIRVQDQYTKEFYEFAKMLFVFDDIVQNAVPIEVYTDKYVNTHREDNKLDKIYVLLGAYSNDGYIIPVEFIIKKFIDGVNTPNRLYVSLPMNKIKIEDTLMARRPDSKSASKRTPVSSMISITELVKHINPQYGEFLKYLPDGMLSDEQKTSKRIALEDEGYRLSVMRGEDVSGVLEQCW